MSTPTAEISIASAEISRRVSEVLELSQIEKALNSPLLVTDDLTRNADGLVLIVDPNPVDFQNAIDAVSQGRTRGVVASDNLLQLPAVLQAVDQGLVVLPTEMLTAVLSSTPLSERSRQVLSLIIEGKRNAAIASHLHVSEATVKREVSFLLERYSCSSRTQLAVMGSQKRAIDLRDQRP